MQFSDKIKEEGISGFETSVRACSKCLISYIEEERPDAVNSLGLAVKKTGKERSYDTKQ
jgi:hypothetical protein